MKQSIDQAHTKPARHLSLDWLRGIAVIFMIEQHLMAWLWQIPQTKEQANPVIDLPMLLLMSFGGGAAPLFIVLAGIGSTLFLHKTTALSTTVNAILLRRGFTLLLLGYAVNLLTPSWFSWLSWFVLHLMGLGMMLTPLLKKLANNQLLLLALGIIFLAGPIQYCLNTENYLDNYRMAGWSVSPQDQTLDVGQAENWVPYAFARVMLAEGQFPIVPWLGFFIVGLIAGRWLVTKNLTLITRSAIIFYLMGFALVIAGWLIKPVEHSLLWYVLRVPMVFFPSSTAISLLLLATVLLAINWIFRREQKKSFQENNLIICLGRCSLTLLILHVIIFREIAPAMGLYGNLSATATLLVVLAVIMGSAFFSRWWQRYDYRYGAEWLLRKAGGKA